ncbi:DUF6790 family protein [Gordonia alkanivorans]|uniref:DUF6790 family protein n=1 Tax=Gordonia alkanivorans TaxID=84096 RepID=UPI00244A4047|nr:DUF6790 family protein [Gordonia alkanivorans]MDH3005313.1 hypothetical protein [Gordonia alkanivorans]MDH3014725.1 hypothetical protein [Gordonia alkanivorans]MDH3039654.1 hypothetical protein [Gordonia alkanivorans]
MVFFMIQLALMILGAIVHISVDRSARRRTTGRAAELVLLWILVPAGVFGILGGFGHVGPNAPEIAKDIGPDFIPGMFQWELGWNDIAVGLLCVLTFRVRNRGGWLDAAVWALAISYGGDLAGHISQYYIHDNTATNNVWAIPAEIYIVGVAVIAWVIYRRTTPRSVAILGPNAARGVEEGVEAPVS